ncbi:MAG: AraC family transcriptional regulator [Clostridia bacterium]
MLPIVETHQEDCIVFPFTQLVFPEHIHAHFEIIYVKQGCQTVRIDGLCYLVKAGELAFIFPDTLHSYVETAGDREGLLVIFSPKVGVHAPIALHPAHPVMALDACHAEVAHCLQQLLLEGEQLSHEAKKAYVHLLLIRAMERLPLVPLPAMVQTDVLYEAVDYLSKHFEQPLTLKGVARALGINDFYLSHVFAQRLHSGFRTYLNALRVAMAQQLLSGSHLSVTRICYDCGFENLRTFDRVFLKQCGCTPRNYRLGQHLNHG